MKNKILNKSIGGMWFILYSILFLFSFSAVAGVPSGEKIKPTKLVTEPAAVKGQVLVKFKNANQQQNIRSVSALGVSVEKYYAQVGNIALLSINDERVSVKEMVHRLNQTAGNLIEFAEPNYKVKVLGTPNDTKFNDLWGMHNTGQTGGVADADIDAVEAWSIATDASNVVIAVIDTGVDYTHPDLVSNMWRNPGEIAGNGIDDDNNGHIDDIYGIDTVNNDSDPMDDQSHGTHVAGTIGGSGNNNQGVTGVAWNVQIMALKFLSASGSGSTAGAIAAINYAVDMKVNHNINVILTNNSWGGGGFSQSLKDAIDASGAANMLFIAAAGNVGSNDNDTNPHYPSSYTSPNIITVASSNESDGRSSFSSYGFTSVDLAAPGSNIWSTTPNNSYASFNGTSMATPHVSGAAALLWSTLINPHAADVKQTLLSTVDTLSAFNGITVTGGRLNIYNALHDNCDPTQYRFNTAQPDGFSEASGVQTVLTASLTNCAPTTGATVTASFNNGDTTVNLLDDGAAPDVQANDGVYSAHWTPGNVGAVTISYSAIHNNTTYRLQRIGTITEQVVYQVDDQHAFNWIDISSTGTNLNLSDDSHFFPVDFAFNFYGRDYTQVAVGSNGGISFQNSYLTSVNVALPTTGPSFIALMWDDINPSGGAVYYEIQGTKLIIQYDQTPRFGFTNEGSFQVMLDSSNGNILMQYLDVDFGNASYNGGASATIGLQATPDFAQQYSYNTAAVSDNQAILWSPDSSSTTPAITSPADGSILTSADVTFEFNGPLSVTNWWLYLGPTDGSARYFDSGLLPANATHVDVTGLPVNGSTVNGSTVYATLWYQNGNGWEAARSSYTTIGHAPEITAPVDGSTLTGSNVTFEFDGAASVSNWWLYIGSARGNARYYNSGLLAASTRSVNVTGLPLDSSTLYARLWYNDGSGWRFIDGSYTAGVVTNSIMISPTPNSTLTDSREIFSWTAGQATVDKWWVYVGSTHGGRDLYNSGDLGTSTSRAINNLPTNGSTLHVRLWYLIGGSIPSVANTLSPSSGNISITSETQAGRWSFQDFMYTAVTLTQTEITSPTNGSTLSGSNVTFEFSGPASITGWWVYIGSGAGRSNYYDSGSLSGSATSVDATGLPTNGSTVHATLWYRYASGGWQSAAFSYTAAN